MQFQVPQFIEVEDKIFGPLTLKQFVYLAGGAGIAFALYTLLPLFLTILIGGPIVGLAVALAFYRVNNRPFIEVVEAAVSYFFSRRLYVWKKEERASPAAPIAPTVEGEGQIIPKLSESKLKDLAWSLDIKESIYSSKNQQK